MDLTNTQWSAIEPLLPRPTRRPDGRGRPWREPRGVLNGILWILRTGAPWKDLPPRYPPYQTCHRRFQGWVKDGTLQRVMDVLGEELKIRTALDGRRTPVSGYPGDSEFPKEASESSPPETLEGVQVREAEGDDERTNGAPESVRVRRAASELEYEPGRIPGAAAYYP